MKNNVPIQIEGKTHDLSTLEGCVAVWDYIERRRGAIAVNDLAHLADRLVELIKIESNKGADK